MLQNKRLETIEGDYRSFSKLVPETRRHVDELLKDGLVISTFISKLMYRMFWTADGAIYFLSKDGKSRDRNGRPHFALTREYQNPLFKNLDEACEQLLNTRDYRVPDKDLEFALADLSTEVFDLDGLNLNCYSNEYSYLEVPTNPRIHSLEDDPRRLVERVYGKGDNFEKVIAILAKIRLPTPRVYVLNPSYVRKHASAGAIGRASWLGSGSFCADGHGINICYRLSGVVASERSESNSDCAKKRGRLSVFKGMEGGELSVINNNIGGLTVTSEEPIEEKRSYWQRFLGR